MNNGAFLVIFALAIFIGAIFVTEEVKNDIEDRPYSPGDVISIFFGIMFAAFTLGLAGPNFKAITKGRQAAYSALQTIERVPDIKLDCEDSTPLENIKGEIVIDNVSFKYKT